jgi:hypothetical protein
MNYKDNMSMEKDLADIMLGALTIDIRDELKQPDVPLSEQIRIIKNYINTLPIQSRKTTARVASFGGYKSLFTESPEGVTINLDKLPEYIINDMYEQVLANKN